MRTLVDITGAQVQALDDLAKRHKQSRAALIRSAIDDFLAKHRRIQATDAFGLWGERQLDGLEYQERVRGEW